MKSKEKRKVFFSHSSCNVNMADQLVAMMKNAEMPAFKAFCSSRNGQEIKATKKINDDMLAKLRKADDIIYLVTRNFLQSIRGVF